MKLDRLVRSFIVSAAARFNMGGLEEFNDSPAISDSASSEGPFSWQMLINCCLDRSPPVPVIAHLKAPLTRLICMYLRLAKRLLLETDKRLLFKLAYLAGFKGLRSVQKHKSRLKRGEFFPPFLYISIINTCNLRCQGCWVDVAAKQTKIDFAAMNKTLTEAKAMGNSFFGILGGEPFMHKELLDILAAHPDAYFQVFTNGHFITDEVAKRLRQLGNVTPLISVEGSQIVSDTRRGRDGVLSKTMEGLQNCLNNKVMTGVCTSVCKSNIDDSLNDAWVDRLVEMGVMYCWFHVFRVVGPESSPELALDTAELARVREFVVSTRVKKPIIVIDAYHDGKGRALCPAVTGFTHHIGPGGHIEPCPIIQIAQESIHDGRPLKEVFQQSEFLRDFRETVSKHTRGCVVLERPDLLEALAAKHGAKDSTIRQTALQEIAAITPRRSQYVPGAEIPERSWAYRLAKWYAFHDYGTYTRNFDAKDWVDPDTVKTAKTGTDGSEICCNEPRLYSPSLPTQTPSSTR